jgi:hypothetical protein
MTINRSLVVTTVLAGALLCGCGKSEGERKTENPRDRAKTPRTEVNKFQQMEATIAKGGDVDNVITQLEATLVQEIREHGMGQRYAITNIMPVKDGSKGSITFTPVEQGGVLGTNEFPGDGIAMSLPFGGTVVAKSGSRWIPSIFNDSENPISPSPDVPGADGSIHRYTEGPVTMAVSKERAYLIFPEGDKRNRLTFALVDKVGYVYLRGNGGLIMIEKESGKKEGILFSNGVWRVLSAPAKQ